MILPEAHKQFKAAFKTSLNPFLDGMLMLMLKQPVIDIVKFDGWLHKQCGDYESEGKSMNDILSEKYGKAAARLIYVLSGGVKDDGKR
jgi:hypothetical protein